MRQLTSEPYLDIISVHVWKVSEVREQFKSNLDVWEHFNKANQKIWLSVFRHSKGLCGGRLRCDI